ncbi:DOMON domain-containing protein [Sediminispirochaeta bajacaliforniensis]|uniref:DOMON domain-containing protein n=1 Tax=Sediminispirochaeta bajacaliforniensis TaxID=148 RepID=UPI000382C08D|nr:DOMON domain-containing protein [Sediminispirochaeta bajacaliforniensis]
MKRVLFILFLAFLILTPLAAATESTREIAGVTVTWKAEGEYVLITMSAKTTGWIAVGIEPENKMKGADMYIGYVDDKGAVVLEDHYGHRTFGHKSDVALGGSSDVEIIQGTERGGETSITFRIPKNSRDAYDKLLEEGKEYTVITAWGEKDNLTARHKGRGSGRLLL